MLQPLRRTRFALAALLAIMGCTPGVNPIQAILGGTDSGPEGFVGIVYLNKSKSLIQPIVSLTYDRQPPIVWVSSVTPDSWDSILIESGVTQASLVGVIPVNLSTGEAGEQVDYNGAALVTGERIAAGSVIVVEVSDASEGSVSIQVRTIPETLSATDRRLRTSPLAPGSTSGFVLLQPAVASGLSLDMNASWAGDDGLIYQLTWVLAGRGPTFGTLVECPVEGVGFGRLGSSDTPGATVGDGDVPVAAPAPLEPGTGFQCGDRVILRATGSSADPASVQLALEATSAGADVGGQLDLFGAIRNLLDETGFAGKPSNSNALLPPIGVGK